MQEALESRRSVPGDPPYRSSEGPVLLFFGRICDGFLYTPLSIATCLTWSVDEDYSYACKWGVPTPILDPFVFPVFLDPRGQWEFPVTPEQPIFQNGYGAMGVGEVPRKLPLLPSGCAQFTKAENFEAPFSILI